MEVIRRGGLAVMGGGGGATAVAGARADATAVAERAVAERVDEG